MKLNKQQFLFAKNEVEDDISAATLTKNCNKNLEGNVKAYKLESDNYRNNFSTFRSKALTVEVVEPSKVIYDKKWKDFKTNYDENRPFASRSQVMTLGERMKHRDEYHEEYKRSPDLTTIRLERLRSCCSSCSRPPCSSARSLSPCASRSSLCCSPSLCNPCCPKPRPNPCSSPSPCGRCSSPPRCAQCCSLSRCDRCLPHAKSPNMFPLRSRAELFKERIEIQNLRQQLRCKCLVPCDCCSRPC